MPATNNHVLRLLAAIVALLWVMNSSQLWADSDRLNVAAASSLRTLWPDLMQGFIAEQPAAPTFSSSGNLYRQISQGAPFQLFLSADAALAERLVAEQALSEPALAWAEGPLSWVVHSDSALRPAILDEPESQTPSLLKLLQSLPVRDDWQTLAMANPEHAPYGKAAQAVLASVGSWDAINSDNNKRISLAENAAQALQFVLSRVADGALVPTALLQQHPQRDQLSVHSLNDLPEEHQRAVTHHVLLLHGDRPAAQQMQTHLFSTAAASVLQQHGLIPLWVP